MASTPPSVRGEGVVAERKFVAPADRAAIAEAILETTCFPDPDHPRGTVCSLYFDRPGVPALDEKNAGDFLKLKVRLRWYREDLGRPTVPAWIEVKRRIGGGRLKDRRRVSLPAALLARDPWDADELVGLVARAAAEMTGGPGASLAPLIELSYERARHLCPFTGARVSLDTHIRAERFNPSLLAHLASPELGVAILEVKTQEGAGEVPWLGRMARAGFRKASFSKFGALLTHLI